MADPTLQEWLVQRRREHAERQAREAELRHFTSSLDPDIPEIVVEANAEEVLRFQSNLRAANQQN